MMRLVIVLTAFAVCVVGAIPYRPQGRSYSRFVTMSDSVNETRVVDLEEPVDFKLLDEITRNPDHNQYWLYTRRNPEEHQLLVINDENSVRNSNFDTSRPVKVICHGWTNTGHSEPNPTLRAAFLARGDVNVITVDWGQLAGGGYATAVSGVPAVGRGVGQFLAFLNRIGMPWTSVHLIGFSLGAHVAGNAGREVGGRVARVTGTLLTDGIAVGEFQFTDTEQVAKLVDALPTNGLDPAGPLWLTNSDKIQSGDGVYVEGIHTDGNAQGIGSAIGHVDFFPNGGTSMPGCITTLCNHHMAWEYFGATVTYNHLIGNRCDSSLQASLNRCDGPTFPMGNDDLTKSGSGIYRVNTERNYPF